MKKTNIIYLILIFLLIYILSGCSLTSNNQQDNKEKISSELEFYETKIVSMINNLSNIPQDSYDIVSSEREITKENAEQGSTQEESSSSGSSESGGGGGSSSSGGGESGGSETAKITELKAQTILDSSESIDWNYLKQEIELINNAWNITVTDLYNLNVNNDDILQFSNLLNDCTLNIKVEDKTKSQDSLIALYRYIVEFFEKTEKEQNFIKLKQSETFVLESISNMEKNDWVSSKNNVELAIEKVDEIMKDYNYMKEKQNQTNKIYVALNELLLGINKQDRDIFLIKYRNLIEKYKKIRLKKASWFT